MYNDVYYAGKHCTDTEELRELKVPVTGFSIVG